MINSVWLTGAPAVQMTSSVRGKTDIAERYLKGMRARKHSGIHLRLNAACAAKQITPHPTPVRKQPANDCSHVRGSVPAQPACIQNLHSTTAPAVGPLANRAPMRGSVLWPEHAPYHG